MNFFDPAPVQRLAEGFGLLDVTDFHRGSPHDLKHRDQGSNGREKRR